MFFIFGYKSFFKKKKNYLPRSIATFMNAAIGSIQKTWLKPLKNAFL